MKKLIIITALITLMFSVPVWAQEPEKTTATEMKETAEQQLETTKLDLQRMELRALIAEINVLRQQIQEKTQRARQLQAIIQAEEMRGEKAE